MDYPTVKVLRGDALQLLRTLPDESVHMTCTSPPYYGLRDYQTGAWDGGDEGCDHEVRRWDGPKQTQGAQSGHAANGDRLNRTECTCGARRVDQQIGLEASVDEHIAKLVEVFREVRRVMRKDATLWLNYGDAYACAPNGRKAADIVNDDRTFRDKPCSTVGGGFKPKDLMMLPHRVAIALCDDGWWVRQAITWCKPSPIPESVMDRCTSATEMLFMLTRSERYFYDATAIREPAVEPERQRCDRIGGNNGHSVRHSPGGMMSASAGRNKRNWWVIPSEAYPDAHFATFPRALVRPCILAGTSAEGCCGSCGAPFVRQVEATGGSIGKSWHDHNADDVKGQRTSRATIDGTYRRETTGWAQCCSCPDATPVPCVVLDPFAGSGTVGECALSLGRSAVLCELSEAYCKLIEKRLSRAQVPLALGI